MDKKGGLTDLFVFMIVAFILSITVVILVFAATTTLNKLHENSDAIQKVLPEHNATEIIDSTFGKVPNAYDSLKWITAVLIIGMMLSILVTSYLIRVTPVFFIPYIFLWIIAVIVSVPLSNTYEIIYENPTLASTFSGFWGQTYIFLNLPVWIVVIGGLAGLIMFVNMLKQGPRGDYA